MRIADKKYLVAGIAMMLLVLAADQASKEILVPMLSQGREIAVAPFFNLVMVWNTGISFGLFAEYNQALILILMSSAICAVLVAWLVRAESRRVAMALGTVIGGAAGNIVDRLRFEAVADFFDFHVAGYHWPAFNIADSAIFIGVVFLCADSMLAGRKPKS
jgi:signal peptidase II